MRTLYERLIPSHKKALKEVAKKWPSLVGSIFDELKGKRLILELQYGCIVTITTLLDLPNSNIDTVINLFKAK